MGFRAGFKQNKKYASVLAHVQ